MLERPASAACFGGEQVHLRALVAALRESGVTVDRSVDAGAVSQGYDLVHVWNLQHPAEAAAATAVATAAGVPVVLTPIYCDRRRSRFALRAQQHLARFSGAQLEAGLAALAARQLDVPCSPGVVVRDYHELLPDAEWLRSQRQLLATVAGLCPLSPQEAAAIEADLGPVVGPVVVAPVAAQEPADPQRFRQAFDLPAEFVLMPAARIEPNKNQWLTMLALRDLDLPVVVVGGFTDPVYGELCRSVGGVRFVGVLEPEVYRSALAAATVVVHNSVIECASLCALDAAAACGALVVGATGSEPHYFGELAHIVDPLGIFAVRTAVIEALRASATDPHRAAALRVRARGLFSWAASAAAVAQCYRRILVA